MKYWTIFAIFALFFNVLSPIDANAKQPDQLRFHARLIQEFIDGWYSPCLGEKKWPVKTPRNEASWLSGRLNALVSAGLVKKTDQGNEAIWSLTQSGQRNFMPYGDFCYGRIALHQITHYESISPELVLINYTYRIEGLPEWAKNKDVRYAFSELDNWLSGIQHTQYQVTIRTAIGSAPKIQSPPEPLNLDY
ncbi:MULTISPECIES: hypothetical protein [Dickeya]|uniref:hypothetical protein n=1 Tax=Dickeya TaxID=204037 RepID=UPI0003A5CD08|nr:MULTISPECIES: hypothetical protein [Dickeya]TYL42804.1 carbapenem biosynthesis protein CpmH [Dickeya sp. ws52]